MRTDKTGAEGEPTFAQVLRVPRFMPIFVANALSLWGDYIGRVTIAAVVFERTRSPLATATTLAVSLLPSVFGRSLMGPLVDRFPYKWVLLWSHLMRAACVVGLMVQVMVAAPLWAIFVLLFALEAVGGAAVASNQVLYTDLIQDRRLFARSVGLRAVFEQFNQALGLALGGGLVALVGPEVGLLINLFTFLLAAVIVTLYVQLLPVRGERGRGLGGFVRDLTTATGDLARHPVLGRLVLLSALATLGISAPEALAIPIAGQNGWGGVLMAAPIVGAVFGILAISRRPVRAQNTAIVPLAVAMPLPLLAMALHPPLWLVALLFLVSGALQAFMVPLQSTFALATDPALRGRVYSLAGAVSVACAGVSYFVAGWFGELTDPSVGVAMCAALALVFIVGSALTWPHQSMRSAVNVVYGDPLQRPAA